MNPTCLALGHYLPNGPWPVGSERVCRRCHEPHVFVRQKIYVVSPDGVKDVDSGYTVDTWMPTASVHPDDVDQTEEP